MKKYTCLLLISIFLISGCGSTEIISNYSKVDIYVNGQKKGAGRTTVPRMGVPRKMEITAKYQGVKVGEITVKRKFDVLTLVLGIYTYGTGFIYGWRYPAVVFVPTDVEIDEAEKKISPWDNPYRSSSPWDKKL